MINTSRRVQFLDQSIFTALLEEKDVYEKTHTQPVLDFTLGSPNIPVDPAVINALVDSAKDPASWRYAIRILPELTAEIIHWYKSRYQVNIQEEEIAVLQGSQEALVNLPVLFCSADDAVIIPDPYYPVYYDAPRLALAQVFFLPLTKENNWLMDFESLSDEQLEKAKIIYVCYPNNPTGAVCSKEWLKKLVDFARVHDLLVVYDNAYSDLVFDGEEGFSFLSIDGAKDVGIELNSFSKSYGMAGARLGTMIGNKEVIAAYKSLKSNLDYGIFLPVQKAGIEALKTGGEDIPKTRSTYLKRRNICIEAFRTAGWDIEPCAATMFIWAPIPDGFENSEDFARELLKQTGILVTPGTAFGNQGQKYVRIALTAHSKDYQEAGKRLEECSLFKS